ncbi:dephospho-CoA kinase [Lactobacillus sp. S2-2]|uniref:dephospho-CoA kinase n=1 Tax=Lactobacillus sp. S2-2 TaxID=2692917 RepID=UPI001EED3C6E|nr:dephospho-CoA kinase [Lactobacillus sp. S2-2]
MNKIIGLTGGISTGKSTASKYLSKQGCYIIDCDEIVHQLYKENIDLNSEVINYFGSRIELNGKVDLKELSKLVFNSQQSLNILMQMIFPYIEKEIKQKIKNNKNEIIIVDAPTFFEMGLNRFVDYTLVISSDKIIQLSRLMNRNNLSIVEAQKRIKAQWPMDIKERLSDFVIDNSYGVNELKSSLNIWLKEVKTL